MKNIFIKKNIYFEINYYTELLDIIAISSDNQDMICAVKIVRYNKI